MALGCVALCGCQDFKIQLLTDSLHLKGPVLFYVGSFSYRPWAVLCGKFLLHAMDCFMWGVSLTGHGLFMWGVSITGHGLFYVGSFSYGPWAVLCEEFLIQAMGCFMWGVSLTGLGPVSYTHLTLPTRSTV